MIKNAHIRDSILIGRPIVGGSDQEDKSWEMNAHMRIEGWMD